MRLATVTALPLPPGYTRAHQQRTTRTTRLSTVRTSNRVVPVSGVIHTVTADSGHDVHVHRADYQSPSVYGGWTLHGYAWRCPTCRTISSGYEPRQFARTIRDARTHLCEPS